MSKKFYITFGQVHTHRVNGTTSDKDSIGTIKAKDMGQAREIAFDLFGPEFFTVYTARQIEEGKLMQYFPRGAFPVNYKEKTE